MTPTTKTQPQTLTASGTRRPSTLSPAAYSQALARADRRWRDYRRAAQQMQRRFGTTD